MIVLLPPKMYLPSGIDGEFGNDLFAFPEKMQI
jgi:hypothetical protein